MQTKIEQVQETYPRIYKANKATRRFFHGFVGFVVAFCLIVTLPNLLGVMKNPRSPLSLALADTAIVGVALISMLRMERRVTLYEDAIEVTGAFYSRKIGRNEIRGRRMGRLPARYGGGSYYIIVPADGNKPELKLPPFLHVDKCFFAWMNSIPVVGK